jgi:flagellar protein FlgJ
MNKLIELLMQILTLLSKKKPEETTERVIEEDVQKPEVSKKIINKRPNLANVQKFVDGFGDACLAAEKETGITALALMSQIALETGWGGHILKVHENGTRIVSNNLFNIKAFKSWKGRKGTARVWEVVNGKKIWVDGEPFRVYDNYEDSIIDYCNLILKNKRYAAAVPVKNDAKKYLTAVWEGGYATDPDYVSKMMSIIEKNFEIKEITV